MEIRASEISVRDCVILALREAGHESGERTGWDSTAKWGRGRQYKAQQPGFVIDVVRHFDSTAVDDLGYPLKYKVYVGHAGKGRSAALVAYARTLRAAGLEVAIRPKPLQSQLCVAVEQWTRGR